jgi:hypothetical protein
VIAVRYVIPGVLIVAGLVCLAVAPESSAVEGWALFTGAGLSVLLLNLLFRIGVSGDSDRAREEEARRYHAEHGRWPDEGPSENGHREGGRWSLPEGIATPESEAAERERRRRGEPPQSG